MPSIFDLEDELVRIAEAFDELEGKEATPEVLAAVEAYFGGLLSSRDSKVDGYCRLIADFSEKAKAKKAEADRVGALAKADLAAAERLKGRLKVFMEANAMTKLEGAFHKVAIQNNGGKRPLIVADAVEMNPEAAPAWAVKQVPALDVDAVRAKAEEIERDIEELVYVFRTEILHEYDPESLHSIETNAKIEARVAAFEEETRRQLQMSWARIGQRGTQVRIR